MFTKKTLKDTDLSGKRVLLRADYNVPIKNGVVADDYRIKQSLPTIKHILDAGATSLVIISHLGRPEGKPDNSMSLEPAAEYLGQQLGKRVRFVNECIGENVKAAVSTLEPGAVVMLENLRFHAEEENNDEVFAKKLAEDSGAEVFVQDGFGVVHRAHASTDAITKVLPSVAGLLLEREVDTLTKAMEDPARPLMAIVGGAKISDKLEVLSRLISVADGVAVTGAMANNFLLAEGVPVGKSLVEDGGLERAKEILEAARAAEKERDFNFMVPVDAVVSTDIEGKQPTRLVDFSSHTVADIVAYPKQPPKENYTVGENELILDIGPISAGLIAGAIKMAKTVIWNGPCGVTETKGIAGAADPFSHGTKLIAEAMIGSGRNFKNRPMTIVGGGDTAGYIQAHGLVDEFDLVSTGGGASLELLAGKKLPGVEALLDKQAA